MVLIGVSVGKRFRKKGTRGGEWYQRGCFIIIYEEDPKVLSTTRRKFNSLNRASGVRGEGEKKDASIPESGRRTGEKR